MSFSNWRISRKLTSAFAALSVAFLLVSGTLAAHVVAAHSALEADEYSYRVLELSSAMMTALANQQDALRGYVAKPDEEFLRTYAQHGEEYAGAANTFQATANSEAERSEAAQITALAAQFHHEADQTFALARNPATLDQARTGIAATARLLQVRDVVNTVTERQRVTRGLRREAERRGFDTAMTALALGTAVALGLAGLLAWALSRGVAAPLATMSAAMKRLAAGDTAVSLPAYDRRDEIGQIAAGVRTLRAVVEDNAALRAEAEAQRQATEDEKARHGKAREAAIAQQTLALQSIRTGLNKISDGEMTFRLDEPFKLEIKASAALYEQLRVDFNTAMDRLQQVMKSVVESASAIRSGAGEITTAADDLSRRTEQQAASLEQTAAALDEITATVRKTAEGAVQARDAVSNAKSDAERSGVVVRQAVSAMSGIEQSSRQIGQIIGVIDEIAFQTNLLALNAGVEAARAGDAGRGFAVVASEVRALAQRSAEAAKEIKGLISASAQQVASGVSLVGETGAALDRIVSQVLGISAVVSEIAASAQEQAVGLHEVNTAINQMDQVTQQNAAMVEQSTAASHGLTQETEALARLIGQFRTGSEAPIAARASHRTAPTRNPAPVPAMKTLGRGGAARKPAADEDGWEEF